MFWSLILYALWSPIYDRIIYCSVHMISPGLYLLEQDPVLVGEMVGVADSRQALEGENCLAVDTGDGGADSRVTFIIVQWLKFT